MLHLFATSWRVLICLVPALVFGVSGLGCDRTGRARGNPLDPLNPTTGGSPQGLRAIAGHQKVSLSWPNLSLDALTGYRLYRFGAGVADTINLPGLPLPHAFVDSTVANGETYTYRLSAIIHSNGNPTQVETPTSRPILATPGPENCWVLDDGLSVIVTLTADARAISKEVASIFDARHLAVDPSNGGCWTTTRFGGAEDGPVAVRFGADGRLETTITGFHFPASVAVDPRDGNVWVADIGAMIEKESSVGKFSRTGHLFFQLLGFVEPSGLAMDPRTGDCWIADRGTGRLKKVSSDGVVQLDLGVFTQPSAVAVDPTGGDCWGIDAATNRIFRLRDDGTLLASISGFSRPAQLAVNTLDGSCWVVDTQTRDLVRIDPGVPDGYSITDRQDFHSIPQDFDFPLGLAIDAVSGHIWVSDIVRGETTKLTLDGRVVQRFSALSVPIALSVDPGPR
ncbi:MAG: NHL repeat-containing protein [candidate division Zixibacteria bacterium]|nr:NHL repeat-containing protein [candidate division Zixibacteria bacterium]